jgi:transposase
MGARLTAELIAAAGAISRFQSADALAAAAGLAPVLRQSGKVRLLRRPAGGNKALERVFYQAAFLLPAQPRPPRLRSSSSGRALRGPGGAQGAGKPHHPALIALARRPINVLWAILQTRQPFQANFKNAA